MVSNPITDPDWATRSVEFIDRIVGTVRRYTTQPLVALARGIVFGLLGAFGIVAIVVLLVAALTRGLNEALDAAFSRDAAVWISYYVLAVLFALVGALLMRKRYTDDEKS